MIDDLDQIMSVMVAAFDPQWGEAWTRRQVSDSLVFPQTHYRLMDSDKRSPQNGDHASGFTLVRAAPGEEELLLVGVIPEARGRGLGEALIAQAIADAQDRRADRLFLEARENNPAIALYRRMGFEAIGARKQYYRASHGRKLDAITFAYKIPPHGK